MHFTEDETLVNEQTEEDSPTDTACALTGGRRRNSHEAIETSSSQTFTDAGQEGESLLQISSSLEVMEESTFHRADVAVNSASATVSAECKHYIDCSYS